MIKRYHYILIFVLCSLSFIKININAQTTQSVIDKNTVEYEIKDTTILIQGIFVKMKWYLPLEQIPKRKRNPVIYIINTDSTLDVKKELFKVLISTKELDLPSAIIIELNSFQKGFEDADLTEITPYVLNAKKYIDKEFLTIKNPESNIIVGYRQSAPVAVQLTLNYPDVFGRSGIFAADFTLFPQFKEWMDEHADRMKGMMFLHSFEKDLSDNGKISAYLMDQIGIHSSGLIYNFLDIQSENYKSSSSFVEFYKWIFSNGHNYIIHPNEKLKRKSDP